MPFTKKVRRRRRGEFIVEQTQDTALITTMLQKAVMSVPRVDQNGLCFLIAYWGDEPVGIAGLETYVDAALMGPFWVVSEMRRHGVGGRLLSALRLAAVSRGARMLYAALPTISLNYFARYGFAEIDRAELFEACRDATMLQQFGSDNSEGCRAVRVDLSWEGAVERD
jgi:N-acetylglutamate synthase-like GNAT family acetyltransferase